MILPINHIANYRYICQREKLIEKDAINENSTGIDYDFNIVDKVLVRKHQAYKYKTPFQYPYEIFRTWTNRTITI